jgi:hypothetical protein
VIPINTARFARVPLAAALLGLCSFVSPASAQKIKIDFDHEADFSHIRTYEWRTHPIFEKQPELRELYATGIQLVLQAGNAEFPKRGLHPADSSPDVFVSFFLHAKDAEKITTTIDSGPWWGGYGWYAPPVWTTTSIEYYKEGMMVLDIIDARTSKLLWRAYCGDQIEDMTERHKNINKAVRKALDRFPPKR